MKVASDQHTKCKKLERYTIIDPCDQVVRVFVCEHGVHDYMYPKQMMIVWPDGKTSVWASDNERREANG